jgi:hypothetical protein
MIRFLRAALFLEFGFMLIVVPWSAYWDRNNFAALLPYLHNIIINDFVRGAVSGVGVINVAAAISELVAVYGARDPSPGVTIQSSHAAEK